MPSATRVTLRLSKADVQTISRDELARRIKSGEVPFMLDVREPEELADGVIPGSVNIPMDEVEQRLSELPTDRDIVVICHLGQRSEYVAKMLNALGYDRAVNLSGGMEAWLT
jgi:rhodanese-related sulfurtransferase